MLSFTTDKATPQDALHVALIIAEALGDDIMERYVAAGNKVPAEDQDKVELLCQIVLREDTLYTYNNCTLMRTQEGEVTGGLIAYPGDDYLQRRNVTFELMKDFIHFDVSKMDLEVQPHEFYLDSMAVWPQFRGRGIARQLMTSGIERGRKMHRTITLACAPDNVRAHKLYLALGFRDEGQLFIFDEDYIRMEIQ